VSLQKQIDLRNTDLAKNKPQKQENAVWETVSVVIQALILALVLRTFLFQPFNIPSGSMKPTLLVGDYLFVSKYSYGYSKYSFPFSPNLFSGRIWGGEPERGDVIVFRPPNQLNTDFIKRLVGLPGDKIQLKDSVVYLNGAPIDRKQSGTFSEQTFRESLSVPIYQETLASGLSYQTIDTQPGNRSDNTNEYTVPEGHYFFMGDNRDNSDDSRYSVGFVPYENLVGKAQVIFLSLDNGTPAYQFWRWPSDMRWGRIFTGL
jgi:signal peptidase I